MPDDSAVVERFHRAFVSNDTAALRDVLADDAEWYISGRSRLAGDHKGRDAIIALIEETHALTNGTFRPLRPDSHDITVSEYHSVLMDRFLAEREGKRLDSHEAIVVHTDNGRVKTLLHYFYDQHAFDDFWS